MEQNEVLSRVLVDAGLASSGYVTDRATEMSQRANIPNLNRKHIESIHIPISPLATKIHFSFVAAPYSKLRDVRVSSEPELDRLLRSLLQSVAR